MTMNYRHICTAGMVAHHGLKTAHEALELGVESSSMRLLLMRHIMMEIANVADLASISGGLYKEQPDLSELHKPVKKALEFFKYIRNVYIGHFVPDLTDKTFEWQPFTNTLVGSDDHDKQLVASWFALETAINTYADPDTGHKIFESDTDLNYPPDRTRFLSYLGETAVGALAYVALLIQISRTKFETPDVHADMLELAKIAGQTDFSVLTKGKR
jgi:hypothetical protein